MNRIIKSLFLLSILSTTGAYAGNDPIVFEQSDAALVPVMPLEDGRTAALMEVAKVNDDGSVLARPIATNSVVDKDNERPWITLDSVTVIPAYGIFTEIGSTGELSFVIGKGILTGHMGDGTEGVIIGGGLGSKGNEAFIGYGTGGLLGAGASLAYIHRTDTGANMFGIRAAINFLVAQVRVGLYLDGVKVVPSIGVAAVLPIEAF